MDHRVLDLVYLSMSIFVFSMNSFFLGKFIFYLYSARRKLNFPEYLILVLYEIVFILNLMSLIYSVRADAHSDKWKTFCTFSGYLLTLVLFYFAFEMSKLRVQIQSKRFLSQVDLDEGFARKNLGKVRILKYLTMSLYVIMGSLQIFYSVEEHFIHYDDPVDVVYTNESIFYVVLVSFIGLFLLEFWLGIILCYEATFFVKKFIKIRRIR